ncbi:MAG: HupE/UreJ family protein [Verrucomicrobiales bacterium]|nr:HupE/UreJ family protein [Verrucomicrobiales bacterium]
MLPPPRLVVLLLLFCCDALHAHPGHVHPPEEVDEFDVEAFLSAAAHPFTDLDHWLTMLVAGGLVAMAGRGPGLAMVSAVTAGYVSVFFPTPWLLTLSLVPLGGVLWKGQPMAVRLAGTTVVVIGVLLAALRVSLE